MPQSREVNCKQCQEAVKVSKSGIDKYYIDCSCGMNEEGLDAEEACKILQINQTTLNSITKNLMISDVCI